MFQNIVNKIRNFTDRVASDRFKSEKGLVDHDREQKQEDVLNNSSQTIKVVDELDLAQESFLPESAPEEPGSLESEFFTHDISGSNSGCNLLEEMFHPDRVAERRASEKIGATNNRNYSVKEASEGDSDSLQPEKAMSLSEMFDSEKIQERKHGTNTEGTLQVAVSEEDSIAEGESEASLEELFGGAVSPEVSNETFDSDQDSDSQQFEEVMSLSEMFDPEKIQERKHGTNTEGTPQVAVSEEDPIAEGKSEATLEELFGGAVSPEISKETSDSDQDSDSVQTEEVMSLSEMFDPEKIQERKHGTNTEGTPQASVSEEVTIAEGESAATLEELFGGVVIPEARNETSDLDIHSESYVSGKIKVKEPDSNEYGESKSSAGGKELQEQEGNIAGQKPEFNDNPEPLSVDLSTPAMKAAHTFERNTKDIKDSKSRPVKNFKNRYERSSGVERITLGEDINQSEISDRPDIKIIDSGKLAKMKNVALNTALKVAERPGNYMLDGGKVRFVKSENRESTSNTKIHFSSKSSEVLVRDFRSPADAYKHSLSLREVFNDTDFSLEQKADILEDARNSIRALGLQSGPVRIDPQKVEIRAMVTGDIVTTRAFLNPRDSSFSIKPSSEIEVNDMLRFIDSKKNKDS